MVDELFNFGKTTYKTKKTNLVKQCHKSLIWIGGFNPTRKDDNLGDGLPIALQTTTKKTRNINHLGKSRCLFVCFFAMFLFFW